MRGGRGKTLRHILSRLWSFLYFGVLISGISRVESWRYRARAGDARIGARSYQSGDERGILRLFRLTFHKRKSLGRWRWEFLESPYGKANIVLLESDKAGIVGHFGGIVVRFSSHGEIIPACQIVDVMVHPAFRGRGAFDRLGQSYIRTSRDNGIRLLYGFNEDAVARSYRRYFGAQLARVSEWVYEIRRSQTLADSSTDGSRVTSAAHFDSEADTLWGRIEKSYPCATVRDSRYLNWRYSRRSDRDYVVWRRTDPASGRIVGMAVLGASDSDGLILELLADPNDGDVIASLLGGAIGHFRRIGKPRVRSWLSACGRLRECAQVAGFRPVDSGFHLNLLQLDPALDAADLARNFHYSIGDYDVH